jgi:hypothetical protein
MPRVTWLTLLTENIAMAKGFVSELERQLREQAQDAAHIDVTDGGFALLPPDDRFAVEFRPVADTVIGVIEAVLVDPAGHGHDVALAWRSTSHPDRRIGPDHDGADVEFFWLELPIAELAAGTQLDTRAVAKAVKAKFPVDWDVHHWESAMLRFVARHPFTADQQVALAMALGDALRDWNASATAHIDYVSEPDVSPDRSVIGFYVDLGAAGPDAIVALINAAAASPVAPVIARAAVGQKS